MGRLADQIITRVARRVSRQLTLSADQTGLARRDANNPVSHPSWTPENSSPFCANVKGSYV